MTTEPVNIITSVTGEVYELADPAEVSAIIARGETMTPGEMIVCHRQCLGLKQYEAAARLGVSTQMLSQWENDRLLPSPSKAREIAEKLDMPLLGFLQRVARAWLVRDGVDDLIDVVPLVSPNTKGVGGTHRQTTTNDAEAGATKARPAPPAKRMSKQPKKTANKKQAKPQN